MGDKPTVASSSKNKAVCDAFINHTRRWRKQNVPLFRDNFQIYFCDPSEEEITPTQYFSLFLKEDMLKVIVENTNLYSIERTGISINSNNKDIQSFIGM